MTTTTTTIETAATTKMNWSDLIVTDRDGDSWGTLGDMVSSAPANLDSAVIDSTGRISEWDGFLVSAPGEEADWNTPAVPVNWDGLAAKLATFSGIA